MQDGLVPSQLGSLRMASYPILFLRLTNRDIVWLRALALVHVTSSKCVIYEFHQVGL